MKKMDENDSYIALLELGKNNVLEGVSYKEIRDYLYKHGYFSDENELRLKTLIISCFHLYDSGNSISSGWEFFDNNSDTRLCLDLESYFSFLEYVELNEARQSSKIAHVWSVIAMIISIITLLASIYFSNKQLGAPITIESTQFDQIKALLDKIPKE